MTGFLDRVNFERKVLKIVNAKVGHGQLSGLTSVALNSWNANVNVDTKVFERLTALSVALKTINQRSGEVFNEEYKVNSEMCKKLFDELLRHLESQ
jgi:hypothetical protein